MPKQLWAPWRLEYVSQADELPGCPLCAEAAGEVEESLVVHRGKTAFALLNKYPYSSGHLMLAPYEHVGELEQLDDETALELHHLGLQSLAALRTLYRPAGFNLGTNIGRAAGAGHPGARAHARRSALGRRHELHAGAGRREGDAGAPPRDARPPARGLAQLTLDRLDRG